MSKQKHHGGAWKVAYADFTTAMMALFIVLWLTSQDQRIKDAVERAFRNPFSSVTKESVGIIPNKDTQAVRTETGNFDSASAMELTILRRLNQDLAKSLVSESEDQSAVKLDLTSEGLCVNVFDRSHKPIFEPQSIKFTPYGDWVFSTLAWEIARYHGFTVELEGHTESGNPPIRPDYGDWEISADRANAVRRKLIEHGVGRSQITKVAGFGDTMPMPEFSSTNDINRRVRVLLNVHLPTKKA
ncbi:MAG: flagellar motor protein MotB [Verrucomicrobiota bacterium]|jgi:chemotaxis protein MotB